MLSPSFVTFFILARISARCDHPGVRSSCGGPVRGRWWTRGHVTHDLLPGGRQRQESSCSSVRQCPSLVIHWSSSSHHVLISWSAQACHSHHGLVPLGLSQLGLKAVRLVQNGTYYYPGLIFEPDSFSSDSDLKIWSPVTELSHLDLI